MPDEQEAAKESAMSRVYAERLRLALNNLERKNGNWTVTIGMAESFDPKETDINRRPHMVEVVSHMKTSSAYTSQQGIRRQVQEVAEQELGYRLKDDALRIRVIPMVDTARGGKLG
jgi:hypothetical protein